MIYPKLREYISGLGVIVHSAERRTVLDQVANWMAEEMQQGRIATLNFICTHNSRRSQLAQIWMTTIADYFGVENIQTFSGGTEATEFNPRAVAALERAGFKIVNPGGTNPRYAIYSNEEGTPFFCFSKTFDDAKNPKKQFAAVMVCSDADENCPIVFGASIRIYLPFVDPKEADGTAAETAIYDLRCGEIAAEMYYILQKVSNL